jgi:hypothetical protein
MTQNVLVQIDDESDLSLVYMKDGKPHCKEHGAMSCNKVTDTHRMYRCFSTYKYKPKDMDKPVSSRGFIDRACEAACMTLI